MAKMHYVYRITNTQENKHYYGVRSSKINPKLDLGIKYFSSSSDKEFINEQQENRHIFKYKIVKQFDSRKEAVCLEIKLHNKFDVAKNESFYNRAKQTSTGFDPTRTKISEETKKKISIANKGKKQSEEQKQNKSKSMLGRKLPESTKENMKKAHQNRSKDNEEKRCNKISEKMKGIKRSAETKEKMSSWQKGVEKPKIQCPHCLKIGGIGPMKQWHFDNCRNKNV